MRKFIDTPVKHYSSGMMVRLAFTVAAFLEPEVLIIDEALSVGDSAFQEKCRQRMDALIKDGRTLLLVSHSSEMVSKVCRRCIFFKDGRIAFDGETDAGLEAYRLAA